MTQLPKQAEVVIVGAGTAGAAAALFLARRGLEVVCVDRRPLDEAGARWVNGVPGWVFDELGLPRPEPPELRPITGRFQLSAGFTGPRVVVEGHDLLDVDMRLLLARLQGGAEAAGAALIGECGVQGLVDDRLMTEKGAIRGRWFVDASGLAGPNLLRTPALDRRDLCVAAQEVRRCDRARAREFVEAHGGGEGDTLCFSSIAGGYSILNVNLEGDRLSLLTGSVPADGHPSGRKLLDDFVAEHEWIGELEFGGSRALPIRRPHDRLAAGPVAAIGDAACQVFPAHGSGIAPQLLAARCLADNLAEGRGPAGYALDFQRRYGGLLAGYDVFRRFSQELSLGEVATLIRAGVMSSASTRAALEQRLPPLPRPEELPELGRALAKAPKLAARMLAVAGRMAALQAMYAAYPKRELVRERWSAAATALAEARLVPGS